MTQDMSAFEAQLRYIERGDIVWRFGRFRVFEWHFIGIPLTRFGISYYVATGDEDEIQYRRLTELLDGRRR